jgi:CrcB protein
MIKNIVMVGSGGFLGSVLRYLMTTWSQRLSSHPFPHGTLVVNLIGCLCIGLIGGWAEHRDLLSPAARLFLLVGMFGGFTTFSTFGYETISLIRGAQMFMALSNVATHVILGLVAVWVGYSASAWTGAH